MRLFHIIMICLMLSCKSFAQQSTVSIDVMQLFNRIAEKQGNLYLDSTILFDSTNVENFFYGPRGKDLEYILNDGSFVNITSNISDLKKYLDDTLIVSLQKFEQIKETKKAKVILNKYEEDYKKKDSIFLKEYTSDILLDEKMTPFFNLLSASSLEDKIKNMAYRSLPKLFTLISAYENEQYRLILYQIRLPIGNNEKMKCIELILK